MIWHRINKVTLVYSIMKKFLVTISFLLLGVLSFPNHVYAAQIPNPTGISDIGTLIARVSGLVTPIAVLGFVGSVIYAGYTRMFALGDSEKEKKSMKIATGAAIGFAIIAMAPLIVKIFGGLLKVNQDIIS